MCFSGHFDTQAMYESAFTKSHRSSKSDRGFVPECDYLELKVIITTW